MSQVTQYPVFLGQTMLRMAKKTFYFMIHTLYAVPPASI